MAWLLRRGEVLASLEVASDTRARLRGFAGHEDERAALLIAPGHTAHSLGSHAALDVAYLDRELTVRATTGLRPFRIARPRPRSAALLLVERGAFSRWGLSVGDQLEVKR